MALAKLELAVAAGLDHVPCFERGGGGGEDHRNVLEPGPHHRHVAGVVLDAVFLLEGGLVRFVDDDEAEVGVGQEQRRAGADHHLRFAAGDPPPGAPALRGAEVAVPRRRLAAEAGGEALEERLGERDFGQKDEDLRPFANRFCDGFEIDFGLARAGDAIEQHRIEAAADGRDRLSAAACWSSLR